MSTSSEEVSEGPRIFLESECGRRTSLAIGLRGYLAAAAVEVFSVAARGKRGSGSCCSGRYQ